MPVLVLLHELCYHCFIVTFQAEEEDKAGEAALNAAVTLLNKTKELYPQMKVYKTVHKHNQHQTKKN